MEKLVNHTEAISYGTGRLRCEGNMNNKFLWQSTCAYRRQLKTEA